MYRWWFKYIQVIIHDDSNDVHVMDSDENELLKIVANHDKLLYGWCIHSDLTHDLDDDNWVCM